MKVLQRSCLCNLPHFHQSKCIHMLIRHRFFKFTKQFQILNKPFTSPNNKTNLYCATPRHIQLGDNGGCLWAFLNAFLLFKHIRWLVRPLWNTGMHFWPYNLDILSFIIYHLCLNVCIRFITYIFTIQFNWWNRKPSGKKPARENSSLGCIEAVHQ